MRKFSVLLSVAIIDLATSNFLFNGQQYFSFFASLGLVLLGVLAAFLFVALRAYPSYSGKLERYKKQIVGALLALSAFLILYEYLFAYYGVTGAQSELGPNSANIPTTLCLLLIAVLVSVFGLYFLENAASRQPKFRAWLILLFGLMIITLIVYELIIGTGISAGKSDELALNYYASGLFLKGQNPYTASLSPALSLYYSVRPTVWLNGSIEDAYLYPAFSFIPLAVLPLIFGSGSISPAYGAVIFLIVASALIVYHTSNKNRNILAPIGVWLLIAFSLISFITAYLAISIFMLLAYVYRSKPVVSGILVGLAASTTQIAWFAIPFFFVLEFREFGAKPLYKLLGASLLTFLVINAYYLLASPSQLSTRLFSASGSLPISGPNIVQLLIGAYPIPYSYAMLALISTYLLLLLIFYLRTDSLKPLMGIVPFMIFFLSWRNFLSYSLPFVPYLLATAYYSTSGNKIEDIVGYKKLLVYAPAVLAFVLAVALIYAHGYYAQTNTLHISNVSLAVSPHNGSIGVNGAYVGVYNNAPFARNVSFYVYSRNPGLFASFLGYLPNSTIAADSGYTFALKYPLASISNSTQMFILAFANGSITSREINITIG